MDTQALTRVLVDAASPLRRELAEALVAHLFSRPLHHFVSKEQLAELTSAVLTEDHLQRQVETHGQAALQRIRSRLAQSGQTLGDAVPERTHEALLRMLATPGGPRFPWLAGCLDPSLLRELLTPVFQEFLLGFVARIPAALGVTGAGGEGGGSPTAGLLGRLGKEVGKGTGRRLMDMGRNVMGGLGLDLEQRIQAAAREFSEGASGAFRAALETRLRSPEGQAIVRQLSERALEHMRRVPLADLEADLSQIPASALLDLLPALWAHNLQRPLGQRILHDELSAWFAIEGERALGDWLSQAGIADAVHALLVQRIDEHALQFFATDAFSAWLARLAATAGS